MSPIPEPQSWKGPQKSSPLEKACPEASDRDSSHTPVGCGPTGEAGAGGGAQSGSPKEHLLTHCHLGSSASAGALGTMPILNTQWEASSGSGKDGAGHEP